MDKISDLHAAKIELVFVFEDRDPVSGIFIAPDGMRTTRIRLDVRQTNMAYYSVEGYTF